MAAPNRRGINEDSVRTIADYAKIFQLHPRTLVRLLVGEQASTTWAGMKYRTLTVRQMAEAFGMDPKWILRHLRGDDTIITEAEAISHVGNLTRFQFWLAGYTVAAKIKMTKSTTARYSNKTVGKWYAAPK